MHLSLTLQLRRERLWGRCSPGIVALTLHADGRLGIERTDGTVVLVRLLRQSSVFSRLAILLWQEGRRVKSLPVPAAAMDMSDHRRLRVWLRWKAAPTN
jgi:hypothetical protein